MIQSKRQTGPFRFAQFGRSELAVWNGGHFISDALHGFFQQPP